MIPEWNDYLLTQAFLVAQRSPDKQTKCGCVIANTKNQIVGQGYNGFPRGLDDDVLPKVRPDKYDWMIHAEVNAVLNSNINSCSLEGCTAYITTNPCFNCTTLMWQAGIRDVVFATNLQHKPSMLENENYIELMEKFIELSGIRMTHHHVNLNFLAFKVDDWRLGNI